MSIKFNDEICEVGKVFSVGHFLLLTIKEHVCRFECLNEEQAKEYLSRITNGEIVDLSKTTFTPAWT